MERNAGRLDRGGDERARPGVTARASRRFLRSLIVDGVIGGVGAVVIFLPQILILFLFILVLEATGYLVRAAFLMDRLMAGRACRGAPSFPCCRRSPARFRGSWRPVPSTTRRTG